MTAVAGEASGDVQARIAAALLDPAVPVPAGVGRRGAGASAHRFAIYRNNVVVGLVDALAQRFPACLAIVGEAFFRAVAREFVLHMPPRSPVLMHYGAAFPDFVESFDPAAQVPYLTDVARLEYLRGAAHHAADAPVVSSGRLQELTGCPPSRLFVVLHPAVRLLRSPWPVITLWAMNVGEVPLGPLPDWSGQDAVIARPGLGVTVHPLPPGGFAFLSALDVGDSLAVAITAAFAETEFFEPAPAIAGLVALGLATSITSTGARHEPDRNPPRP